MFYDLLFKVVKSCTKGVLVAHDLIDLRLQLLQLIGKSYNKPPHPTSSAQDRSRENCRRRPLDDLNATELPSRPWVSRRGGHGMAEAALVQSKEGDQEGSTGH